MAIYSFHVLVFFVTISHMLILHFSLPVALIWFRYRNAIIFAGSLTKKHAVDVWSE